RHLQIDHAADEVVARDQFLLDLLNPRSRFRQLQLNLADRALQPRQMRGVVDQLAVEHGRDFVNAIGKQKAAVQDRDPGFRKWHERAVDVSDLFQASSPVAMRSNYTEFYTQIVNT